MESIEISLHQVLVFEAVRIRETWITAAEVAEATGVAPRTARAHCAKLVSLGLFDRAELFPSHKYRLSPLAKDRNKSYVERIESAQRVYNEALHA